ncbi:hypothetical protein [Limnoglobus roseus]|uniref:Phage tail protein n=1 Tax=Limnoglobus roseus TaxID=2598579 RepID=A0A5C1AKH9_9BACT|nr:hypothetical protein [Limnoglobus roseus]QEL17664.1 hypothetical protein PX52LOC_04662 [Limnoglobus roseus]
MSFKSNFLAAIAAPRFKDADTPWGRVRVLALTGDAYDRYAAARAKTKSVTRGNALFVVATVVDPETNKPVFTEDDVDDLCDGNTSAVLALAELATSVNAEDEFLDAEGKGTAAGTTG